MKISSPYLLFLGDAPDELAIKMAKGLVDWRRDSCVGQLRLENCKADAGLDDISIDEAVKRGAKTMVIGVVNPGGVLPGHWVEAITAALAAGLDIASGMHMRLSDNDAIREAAEQHGRDLHDVRHPQERFETGKGIKRRGRRLLTVGTDCSVGKMYASLALEREMKNRGMKVTFRATGQSGIMIAGGGVAVDAVVADFISGAVEWLSPDNDDDHWDVIEGQGSLYHPSFAGVSLGLLHGAQPDILVMCHEPTRTHMRGLEHQPLPDIGICIEGNLEAARLTNPDVRFAGLCVNTSNLGEDEAGELLERLTDTYDMPAVDPMRGGTGPIIDTLS